MLIATGRVVVGEGVVDASPGATEAQPKAVRTQARTPIATRDRAEPRSDAAVPLRLILGFNRRAGMSP
jgi:hypothetical protein